MSPVSPSSGFGSSSSATSFVSPAASSGFGSSGSAASFMSPKPKYKPCTHMKALSSVYTCKQCWDEHNAERRSRGLPNEAYKGRCEHGVNYNTTNACKEPQCQKTPRPYGAEQKAAEQKAAEQEVARQSPLPPVASAASAGPNPNPRGLSFSGFESVDPKYGRVNYNFGTQSPLAPVLPGETFEGLLHAPAEDHDEDDVLMGGGSKSYRKSARKLKQKAKRSSRKAKRSSRKAKRSSRKSKRSSRKAKRSSRSRR
jgi:hypothetical protein